jgi:hypothetical protein
MEYVAGLLCLPCLIPSVRNSATIAFGLAYRAALSSQYYSNLSSTKRHRDLPLPPDAYLRSKVGLDRGAFWPVAELLGTPPI